MSMKQHFSDQISRENWRGDLIYYIVDYLDETDSIPTLHPLYLCSVHWNQIFEFPCKKFEDLYFVKNIGNNPSIPVFRQIGKPEYSKNP